MDLLLKMVNEEELQTIMEKLMIDNKIEYPTVFPDKYKEYLYNDCYHRGNKCWIYFFENGFGCSIIYWTNDYCPNHFEIALFKKDIGLIYDYSDNTEFGDVIRHIGENELCEHIETIKNLDKDMEYTEA